MPHKEFVLKSKAQAEKVRQEFLDRYGPKEGAQKFLEIEARSPKIEDLPDHIPTSFHHSRRAAPSARRFGKHWRSA